MTVGELIAAFTSVAALVTALATPWTVFELRSQRLEGRRPELLPVRHPAYAKREEPPHPSWSWSESESVETPGSLWIPLFNIGSGPAKDILVIWEYPLLELVDAFNAASDGLPVPFLRPTGGNLLDYELIQKEPEESIASFNSSSHMRTSFQYVLPSAVANQSTPVPVPHMFLTLSSLCFGHPELLNTVLDRIGKIQMRVEYRDLANTKYERIFQCRYNFYVGTLEKVHGELTFE
jgi:hypothetical protein